MTAPKQGHHARRTDTRARPRLEGLEARDVPAIVVGTLDETFGTAGKASVTAGFQSVNGAATDNFGRIVVVGSAAGAGGGDFRIIRLNKDGTPDFTFNNGKAGIQIDFGGTFDSANGVAINASGDIAVVGTSNVVGGVQRAAVVRLGADGELQPGFGQGGIGGAVLTAPTKNASLNAATIDDAGNIVVAGSGFNNPGLGFLLAGRLDTNTGAIDPTFNGGKLQAIPIFPNSDDAATALAVDSQGRIILGGITTPQAGLTQGVVARLLPNGQLDIPFGTSNGIFLFNAPGSTSDLVRAVATDAQDNIYAGVDTGPVGKLAVAKITSAGALDPNFGVGGVFTTQFLGAVGNPATAGVVVAPTGQIIVAGTVQTGATPPGVDFAVVQVTPDGTIDTGFNAFSASPGTTLIDFTGNNEVARGLARSPDGKIVVVGVDVTNNRINAARLYGRPEAGRGVLASGTPDGNSVLYKQDPGGSGRLDAINPLPVRPFGTTAANVRTAIADVNGDGTDDYILVTGPGETTRFAVVDGRDNVSFIVKPMDPFGNVSFTGGAFVAAGDTDLDGRAEVVVTPDQSGGPNVVLFKINPDGSLGTTRSFFAFGNPAFRGGARPAMGDIDGDSRADLAVGAGFLGGPNVEIHSGAALAANDLTSLVLPAFFAFDRADAQTLRNGVFLTVGDLNGDGFADLIAGGGPGGGPRVLALDGRALRDQNIAGAYASPVANFFFGNGSDRGGVRVAATDLDGDNKADLAVGSGEGLASRVRVYLGKSINNRGEPQLFQDVDPFTQVLPAGVFVG